MQVAGARTGKALTEVAGRALDALAANDTAYGFFECPRLPRKDSSALTGVLNYPTRRCSISPAASEVFPVPVLGVRRFVVVSTLFFLYLV